RWPAGAEGQARSFQRARFGTEGCPGYGCHFVLVGLVLWCKTLIDPGKTCILLQNWIANTPHCDIHHCTLLSSRIHHREPEIWRVLRPNPTLFVPAFLTGRARVDFLAQGPNALPHTSQNCAHVTGMRLLVSVSDITSFRAWRHS